MAVQHAMEIQQPFLLQNKREKTNAFIGVLSLLAKYTDIYVKTNYKKRVQYSIQYSIRLLSSSS